MTKVKCSVANCHFNKNGKACEAEEIKVRQSVKGTDMEAGSLESESSEGTVCETFRPKSAEKNEGGLW